MRLTLCRPPIGATVFTAHENYLALQDVMDARHLRSSGFKSMFFLFKPYSLSTVHDAESLALLPGASFRPCTHYGLYQRMKQREKVRSEWMNSAVNCFRKMERVWERWWNQRLNWHFSYHLWSSFVWVCFALTAIDLKEWPSPRVLRDLEREHSFA